MKVVPITKPVSIMIAAFYSDTNTNSIHTGEGFTKTEAIARAVNLDFIDDQLLNIISVYGDDSEGLIEWYLERGVYLSEPLVFYSDKPSKKTHI